MFTPILPAPSQHAPAQHQYETRIRSNVLIKPSIRLRHSPDPSSSSSLRHIRPLPSKQVATKRSSTASEPFLPFPPPHVTLHADDASSKVFLSVGRALMSVDNRAMTVKDLAELSMKCGLLCQNLSAAGQAITTFIRNHLQRCEVQRDQPLLLRHIMSGTVSDDDLVAALHSRVGGAHCTNPEGENRLTNFRRGTMVWYLSKAAGAPCPFSRAGIRLCDYNENGKVGMPINAGREKKRERDRLRKAAQSAGQKRKRLLRSCADDLSGSLSDSSDEEEKRPPKVKLTLRLKPATSPSGALSDSATSDCREHQDLEHDDPDGAMSLSEESDSDSMSLESDDDGSLGPATSPLQPSPLVPTYFTSLPDLPPPPLSGLPCRSELSRRSPSVPYSVFSGSPPPDSEAEDEDFHITMTGARRLSVGRLASPLDDDDSAWEDEFSGDFDADTETQWESPGPRSPSIQVEDEILVKEEPTDVRGFLDAWEDLENRANDMKVIDVVAQAAAAEREAEQASSNVFASWSWPSMKSEDQPRIKQEDVETDLFFSENSSMPILERLSPVNALSVCESPVEQCPLSLFEGNPSYELQWRDVEILGPDSVQLHDLEDGAWHEYRGTRALSPDERIQSPSPEPSTVSAASPSSSPTLTRGALTPLDVQSTAIGSHANQGRNLSITSPSLIASLTSLCIQSPILPTATTSAFGVAPTVAHPATDFSSSRSIVGPVAIHTIVPLTPSVSATEFEGVAVYQMMLGSSTLLRRIDTDFVNISPICRHLSTVCPPAPDAVNITSGSLPISGTWVPLIVAQDVAKDDPSFSVFLSNDLRMLFPDSVSLVLDPPVDEATTSSPFGHQFRSALVARRQSTTSHRLELPPREYEPSWEDHLSTHPPFILATAAIDGHRPTDEEVPPVVETPLSPTEEEMFHVLCAAPEWEVQQTTQDPDTIDAKPPPSSTNSVDTVQFEEVQSEERPLRRSKRVANAAASVATRSRTRSSKRGSRTSLS